MSGPLDELLAVYGGPVAETAETSPTFAVVVRTQATRPDSLNEALDSLAAQTWPDFEVVIVVHGDDAAVAAATTAVGDRLADRRVLVGVEGGGRSAPLNRAIEEITSRDHASHICVLDDDDLVDPGWLAAFADAAADTPGAIIRAVTESQPWRTESGQPVEPTGPVERPFPDRFDLLAHLSLNLTPICSLAYPRRVVDEFGLRFDDDLAVLEDWDFLVRAAMAVGVTSIPAATSLYRRLDAGNADSAETVATWEQAHAHVIDKLSASPVLLPAGDARRLAGTHFVTGERSRHEADLAAASAELDQLTRSPLAWLRAFAARLGSAVRNRIAARRP